ncbi:MAG: hypothetical protein NVSMB1_20350 [Polyangiales bacterium]
MRIPELTFEVFDVRFMHRRKPVRLDELHNSKEPLSNVWSKRIELTLHSSIEDFDPPRYMLNTIAKKR